ncbi:MAG: tetratricopeptide repeat protein, partial [Ekhidna sp.]|nr:tetratricopeptide repeat protein [Ekhidna sp.]
MHWFRSNYDSALLNFNASLEVCLNSNNQAQIANSYSNIGLIYHDIGDYDKTLHYYEKALEIREKLGIKKYLSISYGNIATLYSDMMNYPKSIDYQFKSLRINEEIKDLRGMASNYNNIAAIYSKQKNYPKALQFFRKSFELDSTSGFKRGMSAALNNLGNLYQSIENHSKAINLHKRAIELRKETEDINGLASSYVNLAETYEATSDQSNALVYAFKSLEIADQLGVNVLTIYPSLLIGKIYRKQKKWGKSREFLNRSLNIALETGSVDRVRDQYKELALLEEEVGNFEAAYNHHVLFKAMEDSLKSSEIAERVTYLEQDFSYSIEKDSIQFANAKEKITLENEIKERRTVQLAMAVVLLLVFCIAILLFIFFKSKSRSNRQLIKKSEELEKSNEELEQSGLEVKKQSELISRLNDYLQKDLDQTTSELLKKNEKLEEYAFFNSHKTRAPLARLLGLASLLKTKNIDSDTQLLLSQIAVSAEELDVIIREMNDVLTRSGIDLAKQDHISQ